MPGYRRMTSERRERRSDSTADNDEESSCVRSDQLTGVGAMCSRAGSVKSRTQQRDAGQYTGGLPRRITYTFHRHPFGGDGAVSDQETDIRLRGACAIFTCDGQRTVTVPPWFRQMPTCVCFCGSTSFGSRVAR